MIVKFILISAYNNIIFINIYKYIKIYILKKIYSLEYAHISVGLYILNKLSFNIDPIIH